MKSYEAFTTVAPQGDIHIAGVPFAPGTEVEVSINPKRMRKEEFQEAWQRVCQKLRSQVATITDDEIQHEIDEYRAGR